MLCVQSDTKCDISLGYGGSDMTMTSHMIHSLKTRRRDRGEEKMRPGSKYTAVNSVKLIP